MQATTPMQAGHTPLPGPVRRPVTVSTRITFAVQFFPELKVNCASFSDFLSRVISFREIALPILD
jgi:hypothetical protein